MDAQIEIRNIILARFHQLQKNNNRFSLRAYAQRIGVSPGALSSMLNGKRTISKKMALRIADKLLLDPQEKSELINSYQKKLTSRRTTNYIRLSSAQFRALADWEHFAILSLCKTVDFKSEPAWIASRLGISVSRANQAIDRLVELQLLTKNSRGKLARSQNNFRTTDEILDLSVRKANDQSLELARESLHRDQIQQRDFSSITFAINPEKLSEAKAIIRRCQDELASILETKRCTEVYRFSSQLFPLTRLNSSQEET